MSQAEKNNQPRSLELQSAYFFRGHDAVILDRWHFAFGPRLQCRLRSRHRQTASMHRINQLPFGNLSITSAFRCAQVDLR